jgi:hypothetical protein
MVEAKRESICVSITFSLVQKNGLSYGFLDQSLPEKAHMEKIKDIYNKLSNFKKNALMVIAFIVIMVVNFFFLKFVLEANSREIDPVNPRAHMEKVLREFI